MNKGEKLEQSSDKEKIKQLSIALDRLMRFNKALLSMGAIETREALEVELKLAYGVWSRLKE